MKSAAVYTWLLVLGLSGYLVVEVFSGDDIPPLVYTSELSDAVLESYERDDLEMNRDVYFDEPKPPNIFDVLLDDTKNTMIVQEPSSSLPSEKNDEMNQPISVSAV